MSTEGGSGRRESEMVESEGRATGRGSAGAGGRRQDRVERSRALPSDAPLLDVADVAAYLRLTVAAVRKLLDGRPDASDGNLGERLRGWMVRLSPHRRYIKRGPFMAWLRELASETEADGEAMPRQGGSGLPSPWGNTAK